VSRSVIELLYRSNTRNSNEISAPPLLSTVILNCLSRTRVRDIGKSQSKSTASNMETAHASSHRESSKLPRGKDRTQKAI
jgi:hypothetical protein